MNRLRDVTNGQWLAVLAILLAGAVLRLWCNDVESYSPADESVYTGYASHLSARGFARGYPEITDSLLRDPRMARYPNPLRWGYLGLATLAVRANGIAEPHALAWLSTLCGILIIPLVFLLGVYWFSARVALLASAFTAVSCIELALGRRALQDEVFCFAVLLALTTFALALEERRRGFTIAAIAALTFAFAVKETFALLLPAFAVLLIVHRRFSLRHVLVLALPPLLYFAGFALLARSGRAFFDVGRIVGAAIDTPYVQQYQTGPPQRVLFDLFLTAPLISLLAAMAVGVVLLAKESGPRERGLAFFVLLALAAFAIAPSKNLRFTMALDPAIRLLAAWVLAAAPGLRSFRATGLAAFAAANAAIELELFQKIFVTGGVYDPVTQAMLEALSAVPRSGNEPAVQLIYPIVCAGIGVVAWLASRVPLLPANRRIRNTP